MASQDTHAPVQPGEVVAGKYRVERTLGAGGMGVVVAARHLALGELVALKFVLADHTGNREVVERLMREARATFRLHSNHTVRVHDVGELPTGHMYLVMELLEGRDLRAELAARGPLPAREVVSHAIDTCEALQEAHALGIIHRDLKPGNLFLTKALPGRSIVKILDFGMSKLDPTMHEAGPLTQPETALGTPRYMAPEQWKSATNVDHTADIWALGIVMYELLVGKAPLQGMPAGERHVRLLAGEIPSPQEVRADVPEDLARVVMRCLRADPRARWGSAAHLSRALRAALPHTSSSGPASVEITRTDVTIQPRADDKARREASTLSASPFAPDSPAKSPPAAAVPAKAAPAPQPNAPQAETPPATRAEGPAARVAPRTGLPTAVLPSAPFPALDDFEMATEVRQPLFTPGDYVEQSGELPPQAPKVILPTLKSRAVSDPIVDEPLEHTKKMVLNASAKAVLARTTPSQAPSPVASMPPTGSVPPPGAMPRAGSMRPMASAPPPAVGGPAPVPMGSMPPPGWAPRPLTAPSVRRKNTALFLVVLGLATLLAGVLAWLALRG